MMILTLLLVSWTTNDPTWSKEVSVMHGRKAVVRYQSRIEDSFLIVKATHEQGWHTYAMDNEARALAALQGKMSLGIEKGIEIKVEGGWELVGSWLQTKPTDLSKPELRWFTYGFDQTAFFAARVKKIRSDPILVHIRGQACSGETCCNVDITIKPADINQPGEGQSQPNEWTQQGMTLQGILKDLVPVRTDGAPTPSGD